MTGVRLQTVAVERLNAAQRILLSPLSHGDLGEWQLKANRAVRRLVGADHSVFSLPSTERSAHPRLLTDDTDPTFPARFLDYFTGVVAGEYRFRDPMLERAERMRRAAGPAAFHELDLASRDAIRRSVALQEIFRPAGLTSQIGISTSLPEAEATQFFGFEGANAERRSERGLELLRLLVPAFETGARTQRGWHLRGAAFAGALDGANLAAGVYSASGVLLHETAGLREILAAEHERDTLREEMTVLARSLGSSLRADAGIIDAAGACRPKGHVRCGAATYCLLASFLDPDLLGDEGVLVVVSRQRPLLPTPAELTTRFPLSRREAEVALLLARGVADAAVAERLAISHHTARRYSERVLRKLGIHSRAAVAMTLLSPHPQ